GMRGLACSGSAPASLPAGLQLAASGEDDFNRRTKGREDDGQPPIVDHLGAKADVSATDAGSEVPVEVEE
ncbi:unnamed protein product, partial [marine sediment metagenome]